MTRFQQSSKKERVASVTRYAKEGPDSVDRGSGRSVGRAEHHRAYTGRGDRAGRGSRIQERDMMMFDRAIEFAVGIVIAGMVGCLFL